MTTHTVTKMDISQNLFLRPSEEVQATLGKEQELLLLHEFREFPI